MGFACDGYGDSVGQCFHIVGEEQIFADTGDSAQTAPVVLCKKHEVEARADGATLVPLGDWLEAK
jgi:hypothetical protein